MSFIKLSHAKTASRTVFPRNNAFLKLPRNYFNICFGAKYIATISSTCAPRFSSTTPFLPPLNKSNNQNNGKESSDTSSGTGKIIFTCKACKTRSIRTFSKQAFYD